MMISHIPNVHDVFQAVVNFCQDPVTHNTKIERVALTILAVYVAVKVAMFIANSAFSITTKCMVGASTLVAFIAGGLLGAAAAVKYYVPGATTL